jgi:hypothetical protein
MVYEPPPPCYLHKILSVTVNYFIFFIYCGIIIKGIIRRYPEVNKSTVDLNKKERKNSWISSILHLRPYSRI